MTVPKEPPALLESAGYLLARVGSESRRRFVEALAEHDLTLSAYSALMVVGSVPGITQRRLAGAIGIDPRNLVPVLDELALGGLVARGSHPVDRRRNALNLTAAGKVRLARLKRVGAEVELSFLGPLTVSERKQLLALLRKLIA